MANTHPKCKDCGKRHYDNGSPLACDGIHYEDGTQPRSIYRGTVKDRIANTPLPKPKKHRLRGIFGKLKLKVEGFVWTQQ